MTAQLCKKMFCRANTRHPIINIAALGTHMERHPTELHTMLFGGLNNCLHSSWTSTKLAGQWPA